MVLEAAMLRVMNFRGPKSGEGETGLQFRLVGREAFKVSRSAQEIAAICGRAWVSYAGEDNILEVGQRMRFASHRGFAVISALDNKPLIFEVIS